MSAVDELQRGVVGRLDAVFHDEKGLLVQLFQIVECCCVYAVWACADDQSYHVFYVKSFLVAAFQCVYICIVLEYA